MKHAVLCVINVLGTYLWFPNISVDIMKIPGCFSLNLLLKAIGIDSIEIFLVYLSRGEMTHKKGKFLNLEGMLKTEHRIIFSDPKIYLFHILLYGLET